jgi:hypothetical protein
VYGLDMELSHYQKECLGAMRGGLAAIGGVLLLGGALCVFFAVPSSGGWWLGWGLMAAGVLSGLGAGALYFFPGFLLAPQHRERKKSTRKRAA